MGEPSDERVEAIRANQERLLRDGAGTPVEGWYQQTGMYQDVRTLLAAYDEQRARAERAELGLKAWMAWESHRYGCAGCRGKKEPTFCAEGGPLWDSAMRDTMTVLAALTAPADEEGNDDE